MATIGMRKLDGTSVTLDRAKIDAALGGEVVYPGTARYDELRALWNAMIDRRPAAIVCPVSEDEVVKAVDLAREHGLAIAAKGGGHNIAGKALVDGGLVVDFRQMNAVQVDPDRRRARVQPGATQAIATPQGSPAFLLEALARLPVYAAVVPVIVIPAHPTLARVGPRSSRSESSSRGTGRNASSALASCHPDATLPETAG